MSVDVEKYISKGLLSPSVREWFETGTAVYGGLP